MDNALTGIDQIPEIVEERSEKQTGSRLIKPDIGIVSHNNPNDLALTKNGFGVQEKPVKSLGRGEYSTEMTTEYMTAETDGNTFLTDNASLYTQGYKQFYYATALTNRKTNSSKTRKTSEGETLRLLEEARNVFIDDRDGFRLATSHNDVLLEIDNESLNKNTVRNAPLKVAKAQECTDRALNIGLGVRLSKDSGKGLRTNYMSCTGSTVYNNTEENPRNNCQIITKYMYAQYNYPCINETKCNDTGSTTQNSESETSWNVLRLTEESFSETRTKIVTNEDTLSKGFDTTDIDNDGCLFVDKFPNNFSRTSQNVKHLSQGETHSPLRSTLDSYEPVLRLCKNTTKIFGSLNNGYHTNFSHIYKTSLTRRPGTEQDDDEVD
ncbi:uncharacterized protein LOC128157778 [Crassostrea angulata]|uniref:uncharacterized protein LOC128157778 n=1 Tax=Magallana angulata TaxID=2784310 RepID=UPI0022B1133C|nr:uncharacterized protein LOC128157778 [Crassostrea angulata]